MNMDELLLVIIGAVLGFALSILTFIIQNLMNRSGKIRFFIKTSVDKKTQKEAGYCNGRNLHIPVVIEIQNTSNASKIVRDLCLYLYKGNKCIAKMIQATQSGNGNEAVLYGDNGSYSFVMQASSIKKYTFYFVMKSDILIDFNKIKICYYNESNKLFGADYIEEINGKDPYLKIIEPHDYKLLKFKKIKE